MTARRRRLGSARGIGEAIERGMPQLPGARVRTVGDDRLDDRLDPGDVRLAHREGERLTATDERRQALVQLPRSGRVEAGDLAGIEQFAVVAAADADRSDAGTVRGEAHDRELLGSQAFHLDPDLAAA
jgi:hypothetical protein